MLARQLPTLAAVLNDRDTGAWETHPLALATSELLLAGLCPDSEPAPSTRSTSPALRLPELPHV